MKSFPFDGQVTTVTQLSATDGKTVDVPVLDRSYLSKDYRSVMREMYTNGIAQSISNCFKISPGSGMQVIASPGFAMVDGGQAIEEELRTLAVQASHPTLDRIDTVVLRLDDNTNYRNIDLYVVEGTPEAVPKATEPVRNETVYELVLAQLFIARGTTSISDYRITDTRLNSDLCGLMTPKPGVDTTGIFSQYQSALDEFLETVQQAIDETLAGNLQTQIEEIKESPLDTAEEILANEIVKIPAGANGVKEIYDHLNSSFYEESKEVYVNNETETTAYEFNNLTPGIYLLTANGNSKTSSAGKIMILTLRKNNSAIVIVRNGIDSGGGCSASKIFKIEDGDKLSVSFWQNRGGAVYMISSASIIKLK